MFFGFCYNLEFVIIVVYEYVYGYYSLLIVY